MCLSFPLSLLAQAQCLTHSRLSIHFWWMNQVSSCLKAHFSSMISLKLHSRMWGWSEQLKMLRNLLESVYPSFCLSLHAGVAAFDLEAAWMPGPDSVWITAGSCCHCLLEQLRPSPFLLSSNTPASPLIPELPTPSSGYQSLQMRNKQILWPLNLIEQGGGVGID